MLGPRNLIYCDHCESLPDRYWIIHTSKKWKGKVLSSWYEACDDCFARRKEWCKNLARRKPQQGWNNPDDLLQVRLAAQIKALRESRGWTQTKLAQEMGTTQTVIARLENPDYGRFLLATLMKIARVLDAKLNVTIQPESHGRAGEE